MVECEKWKEIICPVEDVRRDGCETEIGMAAERLSRRRRSCVPTVYVEMKMWYTGCPHRLMGIRLPVLLWYGTN